MNKNKIILTVTGLLTLGALASCGASRDVDPQYSVVFANCYSKDATRGTADLPKTARVFPDWAYPYSEEQGAIQGTLGYVGNGDKTNTGSYTITGNTTYKKLGEDVEFTMTLDEFVVLNPIDGTLVEDPTAAYGYRVDNASYFKIYVSSDENYYYSYNQLREGTEFTVDYSTPGVYKFHIPGQFVKFSYKVFFSASYVNAMNLGFMGFDTISYEDYPGEKRSETEFEKIVPPMRKSNASSIKPIKVVSSCYNITNSSLGSDLSCVITPVNMGGGYTFTEDYLNKLEFWGIPAVKTSEEVKPVNITQYVNTNLIHYYANVPNIHKYNVIDENTGDLTVNINAPTRMFPTNQYRCRVTFPWVNPENAIGGMFTYKDGNYTLNYKKIGVTVNDESIKVSLPTYVQKEELVKKFKINTTAESGIDKVTYDYVVVNTITPQGKMNIPMLEINLTAKEGWTLQDKMCCDLIKVVAKESSDFSKYFKDLVIDDEEKAAAAFCGNPYISEDYVEYGFVSEAGEQPTNRPTFNYFSKDEGKTARIRVDLSDLLTRIAFGPSSRSTAIDIYEGGIVPVTNQDVRSSSLTLDMVESIELGFHAEDTSSK